MVKRSALTSTNTGVAPAYRMGHAVAMKLMETVTTSSPGPTFRQPSARCSALVPLLTAMQWGTWQ